ncbi:MAG TPA: glycosyltransferase family 9 protein [Burkholderiales bacterium]
MNASTSGPAPANASWPEVDADRIERICVIGWGLVGDLFIRIPLIEALRARFPAAEISVIVDPHGTEVLANHPACNRVLAVGRSKRPLLPYLRRALGTALRLRRERIDVSIDLYGGGSSAAATLLINARWRIGFNTRRRLRIANNVLVPPASPCMHWSQGLGIALEPLGIRTSTIRRGTSYYCTASSRITAKNILAGREKAKLIAFNLGAGDPRKCWPVPRFVSLAQLLQAHYGAIPVVFRNPGQEHLAEQFASRFGGDMVRLPRLPLDVVAAVQEQCHAIVTGDSALMHLAIGLKRPVLALFTFTRPEAVQPDDCPFIACMRENHALVDECGRSKPNTDLPVDLVYASYEELERVIGATAGAREGAGC